MTIMSNQIYNVPGIPPDLRQEETILQVADALQYLDKVADDIFNRIRKKVDDNTSRLQTVNDRVRLTQAKVDKLTGSNKATKVHAGAKYPASASLDQYSSLFDKGGSLKEPKRPHYRLQSKHQNVDDTVLREKLQYYNFHLNVKKRSRDGDNKEEGLGGLPKVLPSVCSLLLFNTSENPYKKYVMLDPLGVVTKTRSTLEYEEAGLADAPSTIVQSEEMLQQKTESYSYMPDIGHVPEIAVPDFLPNLLGVADDLSFTGDTVFSIAPSVHGSGMPDLPTVLPEPDTGLPTGPADSTLNASSGLPPPDIAPGGPPPPPPPPSGPPPPPPPPPPPTDAPSAPPPPPPGPAPPIKMENVPAEVAAPADGRASLLDSIRNAGGLKKLKSGKDRKIAKKKQKMEEKDVGGVSAGGGGGGDLMSDLFAKLTMRRKGISGTGKPEKSDNSGSSGGGGSAMDKISSMIPAPPKPDDATESGGGDDDGDWE
ncbi:WASH complex subunit 1 [Patella vulgata]|uniref:WASH complex subunit 1 n=1 Tax=Patella vulgata TaxID=6465 RepID=UPI00217F277D|nr:WASH complex subunit 1 [Patella vulgata]